MARGRNAARLDARPKALAGCKGMVPRRRLFAKIVREALVAEKNAALPKRVGAHVSIAGGVQNAPLNAAASGARAFAMFTKNQRQWQAKPLLSLPAGRCSRYVASIPF